MRSNSIMILRLSSEQLRLLNEAAQKSYPVEACALLFGKLGKKEAIVKRIVITTNVLQSSVRFEIDSKVFYDAFTKAAENGLGFIGFFHSHPAPANPSSVDLQFMRLWSDAVWLIFSSADNKFAAFKIRNSKLHALTLKTEGKLKE